LQDVGQHAELADQRGVVADELQHLAGGAGPHVGGHFLQRRRPPHDGVGQGARAGDDHDPADLAVERRGLRQLGGEGRRARLQPLEQLLVLRRALLAGDHLLGLVQRQPEQQPRHRVLLDLRRGRLLPGVAWPRGAHRCAEELVVVHLQGLELIPEGLVVDLIEFDLLRLFGRRGEQARHDVGEARARLPALHAQGQLEGLLERQGRLDLLQLLRPVHRVGKRLAVPGPQLVRPLGVGEVEQRGIDLVAIDHGVHQRAQDSRQGVGLPLEAAGLVLVLPGGRCDLGVEVAAQTGDFLMLRLDGGAADLPEQLVEHRRLELPHARLVLLVRLLVAQRQAAQDQLVA
jgi:hypothetical protein